MMTPKRARCPGTAGVRTSRTLQEKDEKCEGYAVSWLARRLPSLCWVANLHSNTTRLLNASGGRLPSAGKVVANPKPEPVNDFETLTIAIY